MNNPDRPRPSLAAGVFYFAACPLLAWVVTRQIFILCGAFNGGGIQRPEPFNPYVAVAAMGLWALCVWRIYARSNQRWGRRSLEFREVPLAPAALHQMIMDGLGPAKRYVAHIRQPSAEEPHGESLSVIGAYEPFDVNDQDGPRQLAVTMTVCNWTGLHLGGEPRYRRPTDDETQAGLSLWHGTRLIEVSWKDDETGPTRRFYEPVGGVVIKGEDGKDYRL